MDHKGSQRLWILQKTLTPDQLVDLLWDKTRRNAVITALVGGRLDRHNKPETAMSMIAVFDSYGGKSAISL